MAGMSLTFFPEKKLHLTKFFDSASPKLHGHQRFKSTYACLATITQEFYSVIIENDYHCFRIPSSTAHTIPPPVSGRITIVDC